MNNARSATVDDDDSVGDAVPDLYRHRLVHLHLPSTAEEGYVERIHRGKTTEGPIKRNERQFRKK